MTPRFYVQAELAKLGSVAATKEQSHHALNVLRLEDGSKTEVFNGDGCCYEATIQVEGKRFAFELTECIRRDPQVLRVQIAQCLPFGDKMDWIIEKATELGVSSIQPLSSDRSRVKLDAARAEKKLQHWQDIAIAAAQQCGRSTLPIVHPLVSLVQWLSREVNAASETRLTLDPQAQLSLAEWTSALKIPGQATIAALTTTLIIGTESGFSEREQQHMSDAKIQRVGLGWRVLRSETAGLAALATMGV